MNKFCFFFFLTLIPVTFFKAFAQDNPDTRILQPEEMRQDYNYLRKALEETHPGLYMHHTKEEMQRKMDSLYNSLDKPLPFLQFYKTIAYLIAEVKCEHTTSNPYGEDYMKKIKEMKLLPFQLFFANTKAYIAISRNSDTTFHPGDEVISINQKPIDSLKREIYKYLPSDGNMESSKENMISDLAFNIYYCLFIEQPSSYAVEVKTADGRIITRHYDDALRIDDNSKLTMKNPVNKEIIQFAARNAQLRKNPWRFEVIKEQNAAILTINSFSGNREKLFRLYNECFTTLQKENIGNLLVNLAYNDGGDVEYPCELLSYLIDKPTRFIESEYLINDSDEYLKISNLPKDVLADIRAFIDTMRDGKIFAHPMTKYSMEMRTLEPKPNRFKGNVYFYVNGGTSSAASTCAALAKSYRLATIVGNETAGCFAGGGTTNGLDLVLPNSKITAHTSIVYCKFNTTGGDKDRGAIPDYYYIPGLMDIVNDNYGWRGFIYNLIKNKN
jgi:C-terminal processing protease CtpA/Prc